ncbi:hypothetical protein JTE90_003343 [Oedothorax gibbosus]|uniref:Uncharacterized protein n=1 Tax=Oedothorax gibbosus TaxID=931172 RepID=A0AAV6UER2_9ARAC|nr:hypothetical protein JTE90_003343 [Oedothorax gibbosus]
MELLYLYFYSISIILTLMLHTISINFYPTHLGWQKNESPEENKPSLSHPLTTNRQTYKRKQRLLSSHVTLEAVCQSGTLPGNRGLFNLSDLLGGENQDAVKKTL